MSLLSCHSTQLFLLVEKKGGGGLHPQWAVPGTMNQGLRLANCKWHNALHQIYQSLQTFALDIYMLQT